MTNIPHGNPGLAQGVDAENFQDFEVFLSDRPAAVTRRFVLKKTAGPASRCGCWFRPARRWSMSCTP